LLTFEKASLFAIQAKTGLVHRSKLSFYSINSVARADRRFWIRQRPSQETARKLAAEEFNVSEVLMAVQRPETYLWGFSSIIELRG
jgi:hypothetical protein